MIFSTSDNAIITRKNHLSIQKTIRTDPLWTTPADNYKIEISRYIITRATSNKVNIVNKLVTVFALCPCTWTDIKCFIPRSRSCSHPAFVTGDSFLARKIIVPRNSYTYQLCAWKAKTAPCFAPSSCEQSSC
jgi:hypothetical protein